MLHSTFLLPPSAGIVTFIYNTAETLVQDMTSNIPAEQMHQALFIPPASIKYNYKGKKPYKASTIRQIPLRYQTNTEAHIEDFISKGRITKVTQPHKWCCHVFFVPKPVGKIDLVTDLSPVNKHIRNNPTPHHDMPNIPETASCFATINIERG